ncbi:MAG TPA: ABC transporter ATP-binding protein [Gemmatimonadales bacterium]|nr:ABC transporter ATP-binding protein [Gemmatimonadales bacterium]
MTSVALRELTKRYDGATAALDRVSLEVRPGEFMVILGPSGCGKSTALRCIAGLEEPTSGDVLIGGAVVTDRPPRERDVAMVFQNYALYPHLTAGENIAFPLRMRRVAESEIRGRVAETARLLGLEPLLSRRPAQLSGGERQRVALGRAIVRQPAVFLFDEPLSNLDAQLRSGMRAELMALHRRLGATMLYVTHDQVEAMTMGTRIAVLKSGVLQQVGTPREIYDRPANAFVAGFIGSPGMNLLDAATHGHGGGAATIGFRPEHATITAAAPGGWPGVVVLAEPLGADTLVHVRLETGASLTVRVRDADVPPPDTAVRVVVRPDRIARFGAGGEAM